MASNLSEVSKQDASIGRFGAFKVFKMTEDYESQGGHPTQSALLAALEPEAPQILATHLGHSKLTNSTTTSVSQTKIT